MLIEEHEENKMKHSVSIPPVPIEGDLEVPLKAKGLVIFAHGSGSSRFSERNRFVAEKLREAGFGTLLMDLLNPKETCGDEAKFDIPLLAKRVEAVTDWVRKQELTQSLKLAYFGASTGAAAALVAAADRPHAVSAVISRGGRPDLAFDKLRDVMAPTLLIVGGADDLVLELNREAVKELNSQSRLEVIEGATHLFEEEGALQVVAQLAAQWLETHLGNWREP